VQLFKKHVREPDDGRIRPKHVARQKTANKCVKVKELSTVRMDNLELIKFNS
jgi:hypothetical protein